VVDPEIDRRAKALQWGLGQCTSGDSEAEPLLRVWNQSSVEAES